jgi:restriction system protein
MACSEDRSFMGGDSSTLRPHGGYRRLRSFRVTEIIYDGTVAFCRRFVDKRSRTHDQMVQAARSGRQNIAEGSRASATSSQTELRLVNVARASLDELLLDYEDFLRQRGFPTWDKDGAQALEVRALGRSGSPTAATYAAWLQHANPSVVANTLICLIHQANYLLDRQIRSLERQFIAEGGYSERLHAARLEARRRQAAAKPTDLSDRSDRSELPPPAPTCPACGSTMVVRTARKGRKAGSQFWGCSDYPQCTATLPVWGDAGDRCSRHISAILIRSPNFTRGDHT